MEMVKCPVNEYVKQGKRNNQNLALYAFIVMSISSLMEGGKEV